MVNAKPHHIPRIRLEHAEHVKEKFEGRVARRDTALVEKGLEIERLRKRLNEKPSREMARLRLGFESAEREETGLSTINGKYQDLLREKEQLELRNASLRGQVDGEIEEKAEFARMLDAQKGAAIAGVRQGLEAGIVHGRKGTDINSIPSFNLNAAVDYSNALSALNDGCTNLHKMGLGLLPILRLVLLLPPGGGAEQFIIAPSIPYAEDASATAKRLTPVEEVVTVESDFKVLVETTSNIAAPVTLASAPDVSASLVLQPWSSQKKVISNSLMLLL
nr:hypothetical protein [Tanacetum cinerariifolium]